MIYTNVSKVRLLSINDKGQMVILEPGKSIVTENFQSQWDKFVMRGMITLHDDNTVEDKERLKQRYRFIDDEWQPL